MNGCRDCRGTGIAQYRMMHGGPRVSSDHRCGTCGTRWFIRDGLVVVDQEPVQPLSERPELSSEAGAEH